MSKAIIQCGYEKYIVSSKDAMTILTIIAKAEVYKDAWHKEEEGGTTHHVYDQDCVMSPVTIMPEALYQMAKLAGKPQEK